MKNPLIKRLPRELRHDFGKYIAVFLFMSMTISFCSGFLVASRNLQIEYDKSFEKYNIEDGHFVLTGEITDNIRKVVQKRDITLFEDFYKEESTDTDGVGGADSTLRIFHDRDKINGIDLLEGKMPENANEIILDRLYMKNNELNIGDTIKIGSKDIHITGIVALSDYSAMYQDNNQFMFDCTKFGVAVMNKEGWESFGKTGLSYNYAWKYAAFPANDDEEKEISENFSIDIMEAAVKDDLELDIFIPRYANQAINYAGNDMGHDRPMMEALLYVLTGIMAFVFAVTINHTIESEANVIGTLRASGYSRRELYFHYISMPLLVTIMAAIVGNVLGYTLFERIAANLYLNSYDLTSYVTYFYPEAFIKTTVVPVIITYLVMSVSIIMKLRFSPLDFLKRNITSKERAKAVKLPKVSFMNRFRLRIILQNLPNYIILLAGVTFSCLLLMFGLLMKPLIHRYSDNALKYKPADYQYILSSRQEVDESIAEKFCMTSLKMVDDFYSPEDISVYGIQEKSKYIKDLKLPEKGVIISSFEEKSL